jgi:hypothetical protein
MSNEREQLEAARRQLNLAFQEARAVPDRAWITYYIERLQRAVQAGDPVGGAALGNLVLYLLLASDEPLEHCLSVYDEGALMAQAGLELQDNVTPEEACLDLIDVLQGSFDPRKNSLARLEQMLRLVSYLHFYPPGRMEERLAKMRQLLREADGLVEWLDHELNEIVEGMADPGALRDLAGQALAEYPDAEHISLVDRVTLLLGAVIIEFSLGEISPEEMIGLRERMERQFNAGPGSLMDLTRLW